MPPAPPIPKPPAEPDMLRPFGKYFLVRKIAEGGMAELFLAKHIGQEGFERNVVIKRMLPRLSSEPDFVEMFQHEAKLAARLTHQNIIQINDLDEAEGCFYLCMEYIPGEDFSTVVRTAGRKRQYVPLNVVVRIIIDAAHGLHFAHESIDEQGRPLNIVHRDISPSNIYVTYQGQVKLLDFGIAKAESRLTLTTAGVVKGKYTYMSPEQARGDKLDRRSDLFSLGVSLYEAFTHIRPFYRDSDLGILNAVLKGEFSPPRALRPDLPVELEAVVLKAMAGRADERYPTAAALAADLEKLPVSTSKQVSSYLKELFGEEAVAFKTRIPSFASLVSSGAGGFSADTKTQAARPSGMDAASRVGTLTPGTVPSAKPRTRRRPNVAFILGVTALGVVAVVGAWAWSTSRRLAAFPVPALAAPAALAVSTPPEPKPMPPGDSLGPDAGQLVAAANPGLGSTAVGPALPHVGHKPVVLDEGTIQQIVDRHRAPITRCFEAFKSDLPSEEGQVTVTFTILGSGKVVDAAVGEGLSGTRVGSCVQERVSGLHFPNNNAKETRLGIPFAYHFQR